LANPGDKDIVCKEYPQRQGNAASSGGQPAALKWEIFRAAAAEQSFRRSRQSEIAGGDFDWKY
jgi:hypothetical protein